MQTGGEEGHPLHALIDDLFGWIFFSYIRVFAKWTEVIVT